MAAFFLLPSFDFRLDFTNNTPPFFLASLLFWFGFVGYFGFLGLFGSDNAVLTGFFF